MASVSGEGKSGDGKTRGIDKTFRTKGLAAKEEESSKNVTSTEIKYRLVSGE